MAGDRKADAAGSLLHARPPRPGPQPQWAPAADGFQTDGEGPVQPRRGRLGRSPDLDPWHSWRLFSPGWGPEGGGGTEGALETPARAGVRLLQEALWGCGGGGGWTRLNPSGALLGGRGGLWGWETSLAGPPTSQHDHCGIRGLPRRQRGQTPGACPASTSAPDHRWGQEGAPARLRPARGHSARPRGSLDPLPGAGTHRKAGDEWDVAVSLRALGSVRGHGIQSQRAEFRNDRGRWGHGHPWSWGVEPLLFSWAGSGRGGPTSKQPQAGAGGWASGRRPRGGRAALSKRPCVPGSLPQEGWQVTGGGG